MKLPFALTFAKAGCLVYDKYNYTHTSPSSRQKIPHHPHLTPSNTIQYTTAQPLTHPAIIHKASKQAPSAQSPHPAQPPRSSAGDVNFVGVGPFHRRGRDHNHYIPLHTTTTKKAHNPPAAAESHLFSNILALIVFFRYRFSFRDVGSRGRPFADGVVAD